jgi:hypothetical protein
LSGIEAGTRKTLSATRTPMKIYRFCTLRPEKRRRCSRDGTSNPSPPARPDESKEVRPGTVHNP